MGHVVAVPATQRCVAGVLKQKLQRRRFDVAVAKDRVGFALVADEISCIAELQEILHNPDNEILAQQLQHLPRLAVCKNGIQSEHPSQQF